MATVVVLVMYGKAFAASPCDSFIPFGAPVLEITESDLAGVCKSKGATPFLLIDYDRSEVAPRWLRTRSHTIR